MAEDEDARQRFARGRVVMLVDNGVRGDSRVQKEAVSAAAAGWEVILLGTTKGSAEERWQLGGAQVRLLPIGDALIRRRYDFHRSLRHLLAYPPNDIGVYHARRVAAWRADIAARSAELYVTEAASPGGAPRRRSARRLALAAELFAARLRGRWVRLRNRQRTRARLARKAYAGAWDRLVTRFWVAVLGDRAWRRLEPGLWELELAMGKTIDRLRPDLIHANDFKMLPVGARAKLRAGAAGREVRLVWDAHELLAGIRPPSDSRRWMPAYLAYEREYMRWTDAVVTVSEELAEELRRRYRLPELPTVVVNAPDAGDESSEPGKSLREVCGLDSATPLLVYSGGAAEQRGLSTMIEALPQLPGVHVAFVVPQPPNKFAKGLLARAVSLGAGSRVHLAPYVPPQQVVRYVSSADVGVHPTHHYPNHEISLATKYYEYAHARIPIVVSDVRTMSRVTREFGLGEVFRARDVDDYVRAVKLVLADPARYRAAFDRPGLLESWTWRTQAEILDVVYAKLGPSRPRRVPGDGPDVSAILLVRNGNAGAECTIGSLLDQTLGVDCLEVVVVDESTDGSGRRLDGLARANPETLQVIRPENSDGPLASYNLALDVARGRYVTFISPGSSLGSGALERMVTAADEDRCDVLVAAADGQPVDTQPLGPETISPDGVMADSGAKLVRRRLIEDRDLRFEERPSRLAAQTSPDPRQQTARVS